MSSGVLCSMDVMVCSGLNSVSPKFMSTWNLRLEPQIKSYFMWKLDLYRCIPGKDKDVVIRN